MQAPRPTGIGKRVAQNILGTPSNEVKPRKNAKNGVVARNRKKLMQDGM